MRTKATALDATVAADRANVETAQIQLTYATIKAPMAGRTGLLQVHPGNLVRGQDTQPIVTINKITPVYVSFSVPEAQLPALKRFMAAQGTFVFVVKPDQTVEFRAVTVARVAGDETVVQSGVAPGDTVVTDGHLRLVPGSRISVKNSTSPKVTS